jgi:hypothetical protein
VYIETKTTTVRLNREDDGFMIVDGMNLVPRAGIFVSNRCPWNYKEIIEDCVNRGWLQPIAHVKESELAWHKLGE